MSLFSPSEKKNKTVKPLSWFSITSCQPATENVLMLFHFLIFSSHSFLEPLQLRAHDHLWAKPWSQVSSELRYCWDQGSPPFSLDLPFLPFLPWNSVFTWPYNSMCFSPQPTGACFLVIQSLSYGGAQTSAVLWSLTMETKSRFMTLNATLPLNLSPQTQTCICGYLCSIYAWTGTSRCNWAHLNLLPASTLLSSPSSPVGKSKFQSI